MFVYAGIDEAGYGPMLGPLCIACTAFVIAGHDPDTHGACDLWKRLRKVVCRKRADRRRRIAIEDSKQLKGAKVAKSHPLKHLERGVLTFRSTQDVCPACDEDLLRCLNVTIAPAPWYEGTTTLPVAQTTDELRIAVSRLKREMEKESITCELLRCEAIDASTFNAQVNTMGNKSAVNFCAVMRLIDAVWQRWPSHHPRVIVDRLGGRTHYLQDLMAAYPDAQIQVLAEDENLSRYRLDRNGSLLTVSFLVEAESAHMPVALASMTAKYVRELFMIRLNRYFQRLMPDLKPTAGYTEDARRYLADLEPLIGRLGIDRAALVRAV
jgi:ribonuclease HII